MDYLSISPVSALSPAGTLNLNSPATPARSTSQGKKRNLAGVSR